VSDEDLDNNRCLAKAQEINREIQRAKDRWLEATHHAKECKQIFEGHQDRLSIYLTSLDTPLFDRMSSPDAQEGVQEPQGEDLTEKTTNLPCQPEDATQGKPEPLQEKPKKAGWPKGKSRGPRKSRVEPSLSSLWSPTPAHVEAGARLEHPYARPVETDEVAS